MTYDVFDGTLNSTQQLAFNHPQYEVWPCHIQSSSSVLLITSTSVSLSKLFMVYLVLLFLACYLRPLSLSSYDTWLTQVHLEGWTLNHCICSSVWSIQWFCHPVLTALNSVCVWSIQWFWHPVWTAVNWVCVMNPMILSPCLNCSGTSFGSHHRSTDQCL